MTVPTSVPAAVLPETVTVTATGRPKDDGLAVVEVTATVEMLSTLSEIALEVLPAKLPVPARLYTALIECGPWARLLVVIVATPLTTAPVPIEVAPSRKVTRPPLTIAVLGLSAATLAVKVTDCPKPIVPAEVPTLMLVAA